MNFNYHRIRKENKFYLIAEIGVNHECSLVKAKKLIKLAKEGGAHAAKFQTYKAHKIVKKNSKAYWDLKKEKTKSQFELFSKLDKFKDKDYRELALYCKKIKIDFLSTPFDLEAVDTLNPLVPVFKVSSSDINNVPLLEKVASKKKPVLLSTGASTLEEIKFAINILKKGTNKITIMHCILSYPSNDSDANLNMIKDLKRVFPNYVIGYSDHTLPDSQMVNLTTSFLLGAKVIEKHFTNNKNLKGNDHYHAMDLKDLQIVSQNLKRVVLIQGKSNKKQVLKCEKKSRKFARRSIVVQKEIKKNKIITPKDIIALRPSDGISVKHWYKIIGKKAKKNLKVNRSILWSDLK